MKKTRLNRQQGQAAELTGTATTGQPFKEGELAFPEIVAVASAKEKLLLHIREMEELYKVFPFQDNLRLLK
ncbi:hypothetical protein [Neomoorella thermoacetica]|uniref:hypothetical protein n=1 Tax=Neomoorella thermoacetica TaxID=1525 RepID=UPI0008FADB80|nr:hypothetical protein [Moorella thermoacetica]APC09122.1 hypothetical protein MTJW_19730 [Moorella thermoacetica]